MTPTYIIVQLTQDSPRQWRTTETDDIIGWAWTQGFKITGNHSNPRTRPELEGHPIIEGLCGPMWDGNKVRYEDWKTYEIMSI